MVYTLLIYKNKKVMHCNAYTNYDEVEYYLTKFLEGINTDENIDKIVTDVITLGFVEDRCGYDFQLLKTYINDYI